MDQNTITLLKAVMLDIGDDKRMFVMFSYHTERVEGSVMKTDKSRSFYRCDALIKTKGAWEKWLSELAKTNPAAITTPADLGMDIGAYQFYYARKFMSHTNMAKWIGLKLRKSIKHQKWILGSAFSEKEPYLRVLSDGVNSYDISSELNLIPEDHWIGAIKQKQPRKKMKIIY